MGHIRGPLGHTVQEALDAVLAPGLRERVLTLAVEINGGAPVPEEAERTRDFVEGPLRYALERLVGLETSEFVFERLNPLLVMAGSDVRTQPRADIADVRTEPPPAMSLEVLIATLDGAVADAVRAALGEGAIVSSVHDVFELVTRIDVRGARKLVLVDCRRAAIDPNMLSRLFPRLPSHCTFVMWGATDQVMRHMRAVKTAGGQWTFCDSDMDTVALAQHVATLV